jgi:hypothetical protein
MNSNTPNRINRFFPPEPEPPRQTIGDVLLMKAWACKIELLRFDGDDGTEETSCQIEIRSTLEGEQSEVLAGLLESFRKGGEGKVAHG